MTEALAQLADRAAQLRREFDLTFAQPAIAAGDVRERLLAIRMGAEKVALRLKDISGLFAGKAITPIPNSGGALLGLAAFRGAILPVFDLQYLVSKAPCAAPRFLVVAATAPAAFGFEAMEGHILAAPDDIGPHRAHGPHSLAKDFVRANGAVRPVIQLSSVLEAIKA
jgi:purine-binding chemotaxis protein CheW